MPVASAAVVDGPPHEASRGCAPTHRLADGAKHAPDDGRYLVIAANSGGRYAMLYTILYTGSRPRYVGLQQPAARRIAAPHSFNKVIHEHADRQFHRCCGRLRERRGHHHLPRQDAGSIRGARRNAGREVGYRLLGTLAGVRPSAGAEDRPRYRRSFCARQGAVPRLRFRSHRCRARRGGPLVGHASEYVPHIYGDYTRSPLHATCGAPTSAPDSP